MQANSGETMRSNGGPLSRDSRVYVAGHRGLVGSALWRRLRAAGFTDLIGRDSSELDLRDAAATAEFFTATRPHVVIDAAARVGGIVANASRPAEFISDNLRIQVNLLDAAVASGVERFLFLGSSCIYPRAAAVPIREDALFTGPLGTTNEGYAVAKLAGITQVTAIRRQYGLPYISALPTNVYGPGDNFHRSGSHVVPGLLRRFHEVARDDAPYVECWGTGKPLREFIHAGDLADACLFLLEHYDGESPVNVGTGQETTVAELATTIADIVGYRGEIRWDTSQPDGTYRKLLDVSRLTGLGWGPPAIGLADGLKSTYEWFLDNQENYRG
ncbi:GDP-L-fucose synthase [Nocardia seriolae]|uniref:GDP-L-fucose synthase n=1 Tax=Nocardia seriolae TaxID=37332 RepID=A0ABC8AQL7_9NOCA|nr:GDP-L-fucose synthase [Nocardia seriolae]